MRVAVVVVHFRFGMAIAPCVDAVLGQTVSVESVIVVDDASADGSVEAIRAAYPDLTIVEQGANVGYAAAVNAGARAAGDVDAILVLTHETVLASTALEHLLATLSGDRVAVVGPVLGLLEDRDELWSAGGGLGRRSSLPYHRQIAAGENEADTGYAVPWVDGAAFLLRRSAWQQVGGLDESYYLYVEEVDFMQRLVGAGWSVRVNPAARAWQRAGMTPPYLQARNLAVWMWRTRRFRGLTIHVAHQLLKAAQVTRSREHRWEAAARIRGLLDAARGQLDRGWALRRSTASAR
jgi:GT2 family glycosyltransferase